MSLLKERSLWRVKGSTRVGSRLWGLVLGDLCKDPQLSGKPGMHGAGCPVVKNPSANVGD